METWNDLLEYSASAGTFFAYAVLSLSMIFFLSFLKLKTHPRQLALPRMLVVEFEDDGEFSSFIVQSFV